MKPYPYLGLKDLTNPVGIGVLLAQALPSRGRARHQISVGEGLEGARVGKFGAETQSDSTAHYGPFRTSLFRRLLAMSSLAIEINTRARIPDSEDNGRANHASASVSAIESRLVPGPRRNARRKGPQLPSNDDAAIQPHRHLQ